MTRSPCVSICLPVFNGQRFIGEAITSTLDQTFEDLELVISDNASTDGTPDLCREVAGRDHRVRYVRAELNRGLAWNFNRAFELARGRFVVWIGHDDVMARDFIRRCIEGLSQNPSMVLCFTDPQYIDEKGNMLPGVDLTNPGAGETPSDRFLRILFGGCDPICGLMRREVLKQTRLHAPYPDSDRTLLAEMGLRGKFLFIPDRLFHRRMHPLRTTTLYQDRWDRARIFDPSNPGTVVGPWVRQIADFITVIRRAPISQKERFRCYKYVYWWLSHHHEFIKEDLSRGLLITANRLRRRLDAPLSRMNGLRRIDK
jgi:glycosyltransferase involved in cell wall biosynthesis